MPHRPVSCRAAAASAALVLGVVLGALAGPAGAAGLDIHADADLADIGLPLYPGAVKKAKKDDDSAGFSFGLWGSAFGIKVNALSYQSTDGVESVAAFYRDALAKVGPVLDCTNNRHASAPPPPSPSPSSGARKKGDVPLTCEDDSAKPGGRLYKVGTKADHRVVEIEPRGQGVTFELVRIEAKGLD